MFGSGLKLATRLVQEIDHALQQLWSDGYRTPLKSRILSNHCGFGACSVMISVQMSRL